MSDDKAPFCSADDRQYNACLGWQADPTDAYILGFKSAADRLIKSLTENRSQLDALIYPIVFLYRHYIELSLKQIVKLGSPLTPEGRTARLDHHKLLDLWSSARPIIERLCSESDVVHVEEADRIILRFSEIDPNSEAFRYAKRSKRKGGSPSLPKDVRHINIRLLYEEMAKVSSVLDYTLEFALPNAGM